METSTYSVLRIRDVFIQDPDPKKFPPGSGSEHFSSRILHKKEGWKVPTGNNYRYLFSCSLWFQEEVFKKITHPVSRSRIRKKFVPDPGGKKHRIPATLQVVIRNLVDSFH
jgi:hypothetical protein